MPNLLVPICFPVVNCMESLSCKSVSGESKEEGKERLGVLVRPGQARAEPEAGCRRRKQMGTLVPQAGTGSP